MPPLLIRPATAHDAQSIARLLTQLGYPTDAADVPRRLERMRGAERSLVLLAERGGQVVGLATLHILSVLNRPRDVAWLTALVVDEGARGEGVGRALVREVEEHARKAECEWLSVTTATDRHGAREFYPQIGMQETGRRFGRGLKD